MKIRIPIPKRVIDAWFVFEEWANVELFRLWRLDVRRLDIIQAILFAFCVGWYGYTQGPMGALTGALFYIFLVMCALWVWRK